MQKALHLMLDRGKLISWALGVVPPGEALIPRRWADTLLTVSISHLSDLWWMLPKSDSVRSYLLIQYFQVMGPKEDLETNLRCVAAAE